MLFLSGNDAGVKRSFLEIEGESYLSQARVWYQKRKNRWTLIVQRLPMFGGEYLKLDLRLDLFSGTFYYH